MHLIKSLPLPTLVLLLAPLLLVSLVACDGTDDYYPTPLVVPDTTYVLPPTPLPESAREATDEFLNQKTALDEEWDELHNEFDQWRTGLDACLGSAVYEALRDFAVDFAGVTQQARDLPRSTNTRELADALIVAAEEEEEAYRTLRDRWQPNNLSFFELVEQRRIQTASAQKGVEDEIDELREEAEDAPSETEVASFKEAFDALRDQWDGSQDDYGEMLQRTSGMDAEVVASRVRRLAAEFESVVEEVGELPGFDAVDDMVEALEEAAEAELDVLDRLADALAGMKTPPTDAVESNMETSQELLEEVDEKVKELEDSDPAEDLAKLVDFENAVGILVGNWDDFHAGFNDWRKTEGGCDRGEVLEALDGFTRDLAVLRRNARDLPQASHLLPMYNLVTEAAEREASAMRALRSSWKPFVVDVFKAADLERMNSERLRREASIALEELRERFP
jgi:hypothetical protein